MALSATFAADFSNFQDAVSKAETSLKGFEAGAGKVESALNRMTDGLSGTKIAQQATLAAEAVERIGGVSKLTDDELQRLGKTAQEAATKLERMGQEVPPKIRDLAAAAKEAEANTSLLGKISEFIGPKLAAAFSIGAITAWVASTVDAASHIEDLSRKLDISHEAIQRWGFAAELSGASIDDVSAALAFMNKTLAGGSNSTVDALTKAGLSFEAVRGMTPEDAFDAITEAIKNIPDPMDQARIATELFGKGAAAILPAIRDGFREVGKEAAVMSDDMIESLDAAGDTWTRFKNKFEVASAAIIALATDTDHIFQSLALTVAKFTDNVGEKLVASVPKVGGVFADSTPKIKSANEALAEFDKTNADAAKTVKDSIAAYDAHNAKIKALADTLTGKAIAQKANDLAEALAKSGGAAHLTADQTDEFFKAADALVKGPLGSSALPANVRKLWEENGKLALGIDQNVNPSLDKFYDHLFSIDTKLPELKGGLKTFLAETSTNTVAAWKAEETAGTNAAKEIERQHKESLRAIEERHNAMVATISGYTSTLIEGMTHGWDGFKQAAINVLEDILHYMEKVFVVKMLEYFGLMEVGGSSAFQGVAATSTTTAAQMIAEQEGISAGSATAAAATSGSWVAAFGLMAAAAFAAYLQYKFLREFIKAEFGPHISPVPPTPGTPPPDQTGGQSDFENNLNYAEELYQQGLSLGGSGSAMQTFYDYMYRHPELYGHSPSGSFRGGTHGEYVDFGAGTAVMLHGRERVMTQAEGWQQSGSSYAPTIVIQTIDGADTERWLRHGGARQIADALGPHLARVLA